MSQPTDPTRPTLNTIDVFGAHERSCGYEQLALQAITDGHAAEATTAVMGLGRAAQDLFDAARDRAALLAEHERLKAQRDALNGHSCSQSQRLGDNPCYGCVSCLRRRAEAAESKLAQLQAAVREYFRTFDRRGNANDFLLAEAKLRALVPADAGEDKRQSCDGSGWALPDSRPGGPYKCAGCAQCGAGEEGK